MLVLTLRDGEMVRIVHRGEMVGWIKVIRANDGRGVVGFVDMNKQNTVILRKNAKRQVLGGVSAGSRT